MGYLSRQPNSNDIPGASGKSKWLEEDNICDEIFLLLSGRASRCSGCNKAVRKRYLNSTGLCPDCSGEVPQIKEEPAYGGHGCGEDSDTE